MTSKKLKFNVGDKVITTRECDDDGNEVFPIGTKGVIVAVNLENESYPYRVKDDDGNYWFYTDDMLKAYDEEHTDNVEKLDIEAYLIAGEVLEKTNGDGAKIREVIYNLNNFLRYKGV